MTSLESTLLSNLEVTPTDNDHVVISVTLPSDHLYHFINLLESLIGVTTIIKQKERLARYKASVNNEAYEQQAKLLKQSYLSRIAKLFDQYTSQGLNRTTVIKSISAELHKDNHPWSSPDLVRCSLRDAGRPAGIGRPKKQL